MVKPTEKDKKEKEQKWTEKGKMHVKGQELDIDIEVETTPNAQGGYDTKVKLPISPLGAKTNQGG
jgi:hypothetical protein